MLKKVCFILLLSLVVLHLSAQDRKKQWIDSVFERLTLPQKIGQLFMLPVSSHSTKDEIDLVAGKVKSYQPGALLVMGGGPRSHAFLLNRLQQISVVPLLTGLNAEWGLGQTFDSTMSFQPPLVQSAWPDDSLNFQLGELIARQMKMLGIQINFAPRMDLYEGQQDYLNYYSNRNERAAAKAVAFVKGLQENGILACGKRSHNKSPAATQDSTKLYDLGQLDSLPSNVSMQLIHAGIGALLTSDFNFATVATNGKKPIPASLSDVFLREFLRKKIGFQGLTLAYIPRLQSMTGKKKSGEIETLAFLAGHDVLISPLNLGAAVKKIRKAIKKDPALMDRLSASVKRILGLKYDAGLAENRLVNMDNLFSRLHAPEARLFKHRLAEAAITVVHNPSALIPIKALDNRHFVSLSIGKEEQNEFNHYLSQYALFKKFSIRTLSDTVGIAGGLTGGDVILIGLYPLASSFQRNLIPFVKKWASQKEVILCTFGNPDDLKDWAWVPTIVAAYNDQDLLPRVAAQIIFGAMGSHGVMPVDVSNFAQAGEGMRTDTLDRLRYVPPEAAGMDTKVLDQIKAIAQEAIDIKATPGCRILVAKNGKVVYDQSLGWLTYENKVPVTDETIYDLASLTKVSATLQTVMFMEERGLIDINKKASVYLPELKNSNKKDLVLKDILTHQAGLIAFIPLWPLTMKDSTYLPQYYNRERNENYPLQVATDLFAPAAIRDSVWGWIVQSKTQEKPDRTPYAYRYSDLGFMMLKQMAEKILNQPIDEFLNQNLYEPLGAYSLGFNPLERFPKEIIAPTEEDKIYRKSTVLGTVHDERAAMMGGVSGHAGLFGTASDLAKLGQLWLQKGSYGGQRFFKPQTIELFAQKQYENSRRGLGWDKPSPSDPNGPTSIYASSGTFGHTGFTGTCIWVDPEFELVYVFLSNRVYPDRNNRLLNANIRPRIQDLIYKSIFTYCENHN